MMSSDYRTSPKATTGMPSGIAHIIANEAAERFSFYGMRTILAIFMVNYLWLMGDTPDKPMSDVEATEKFHYFVSLVYLTPLLGALLADVFFGKYRVIVVLSIVYCLGHASLALMGMAGETTMWLGLGLWLIALGSGGIKPCVSAHVGDQFGSENRHLVPQIFNWFYWSINLGAFLSTLLTPWLLEWYGPHWAFGVPGILMALATILFWVGRWKFVHIPPKGVLFIRELFTWTSLKAILKLCSIYAFVAVFWSLFDQSGSSWVLQAENMDRQFLGIHWLPSQIQALNPILILTFIPLFSYVVYPLIDKIFPLTALRKISIGLFLMVISFALVSIAQEKIDAGGSPSISWQLVAFIALTASEIMVSIVCLEFSYTQAPKSMKSLIMALFLFAVSLGNIVTAQINHFIQVPSPITSIEAKAGEVTLKGFDDTLGSSDDIQLTYDDNAKLLRIAFADKSSLDALLDQFEKTVKAQDFQLLSKQAGEQLCSTVKDPWGHVYQYRIVNRNVARIWSLGPDGKAKSIWDQGAILTVQRPEKTATSGLSKFMEKFRPQRSWLEARKQELGIINKSQNSSESQISREYFVGGQIKLEGARYFWFFTGLMLAAAMLFVIVAKLYQPREYYEDDDSQITDAESVSEGH
ncbi:MAG: MFS transporter [Verrucomicrobiales bacterium]|nr:MFS transporter [Verrucomicrobiales bacterium]